MISKHLRALIAVCISLVLGSCANPARTSADSVKSIADGYWPFWLRNNPEMATLVREYGYNNQLSEYSIAHYDAVRKDASAFVARLKSINPAGLTETDRLDHAILLGTVRDTVRTIDLKMYEVRGALCNHLFSILITVRISTGKNWYCLKSMEKLN